MLAPNSRHNSNETFSPSSSTWTEFDSDSDEPLEHSLAGGSTKSQLDLHIDSVQAGTTTGDYSCLASNSEGSIEARTQVVLAVPAVITLMPKNQTKLEGDKVEFSCQAKGLPSNITYKWFFNEKSIPSLKWFDSRYVIRRDGTLVIHSVQRDDQGVYKCQASNGLMHKITAPTSDSSGRQGSSSSTQILAEASASLTVEFPARITYSPDVQYLPLGLSGLIRCYVESSPKVDFFTWTLNDQQFDPFRDPNIIPLSNGSLQIQLVGKQYEGKYRCAPFNKHGSAGSSASMDVRVEEPPEFESRPAEFYKASVNSQLRIPCEARMAGSRSKPNLYWRRVITQSSAINSRIGHKTGARSPKVSTGSPAQPMQLDATTHDKIMMPNDEASEDSDDPAGHHLYPSAIQVVPNFAVSHQSQQQASSEYNLGSPTGSSSIPSDSRVSGNMLENEEQQSVIVSYAKLPSDRSELRGSHLYLHGLRKEDHGRYECVIENEVATLVAPTMLYVDGKLLKLAFHEII